MDTKSKLLELLELANNYPSPHNGQPMVLHPGSDNRLTLYFETARGLTATPISYLFSFVTIGVFIRHLEQCAAALGHQIDVELHLPSQTDMAQPGQLRCAEINCHFTVSVPDEALQQVIKRRQTSRKKYITGLSGDEQRQTLDIARHYGLQAAFVTPEQARHVIWLNQRAVFDDMFDDNVRTELDHWLRYTAAEKRQRRDGLSYDCMELSGWAMKFSVNHYKVLHWPIVAPLLKKYYLRTMQDSSSVGYLTSPFETEQQAYHIGQAIIDIWLELTRQGKYLHPFGTIVSNERAHRDFTELVGLTAENRATNYLVFIFRAGSSPKPVESERLPVVGHLYNQG